MQENRASYEGLPESVENICQAKQAKQDKETGQLTG